MQSRRVVRGSTRSWCSLPLIRSASETEPLVFGSSATASGAPAPITAAAAVPPVVRRKVRRVGFNGSEWELSCMELSSCAKRILRKQRTVHGANREENERIDRHVFPVLARKRS